MDKVLKQSQMVDEYIEYIETRVLNNSFDFSTWCQHQFGEAPTDFSIHHEVVFSKVVKKDHK